MTEHRPAIWAGRFPERGRRLTGSDNGKDGEGGRLVPRLPEPARDQPKRTGSRAEGNWGWVGGWQQGVASSVSSWGAQ